MEQEPVEIQTGDEDQVEVHLPHHVQQEFCTTRAPYRQGRKLTAVKVFTVSNESQHLLLYRVPAIDLRNELAVLCGKIGPVTALNKLQLVEPGEEFTEIYHARYAKIRDARRAKRFLDGRSFFGSILHVCYAPEMETVDETRLKLINRRNEIAYHTGRKLKVPNLNLKRPSAFNAVPLEAKKGKRLPRPGPDQELGPEHVPLPSSYRPVQASSAPGAAAPSTSGLDNGGSIFIPGPYDLSANSYPSQEVLQLPGIEVKVARDKKFTPNSVIRKLPKTSTNRIIFHKKS